MLGLIVSCAVSGWCPWVAALFWGKSEMGESESGGGEKVGKTGRAGGRGACY